MKKLFPLAMPYMDYMYDKYLHKFKDVNDWSDEESLQGKIVIVTGANGSIGKIIVAQLAKRNAIVIMAVRDLKSGAKGAHEIRAGNPNANLDLIRLDLGDLASIQDFSTKIHSKYTHVNILINNASAQRTQSDTRADMTKDGFEICMGTNFLGHFLLTHLLLDLLQRGAPSRIVTVSCFQYEFAQLDLEDLMMEKKVEANGLTAFENSKLCLIIFSRELANRLKGTRINCYALCPGMIKPTTGFFQLSNPGFKQILTHSSHSILGMSPEQSCETVLFCAASTICSEDTGKLYRFRQWWKEADEKLDDSMGEKLWQETKRLIPTKYWRRRAAE